MAPGATSDKQDHQIKREFAAKHPYDPLLGRKLAEIFSTVVLRKRTSTEAEQPENSDIESS